MSTPRKIACTVAEIVNHGQQVYSVDLRPSMQVPHFKPGQFLHLTVDEYDPSGFWPESRVFSIASSPTERNRVRICYAVKGRYTRKMEEYLQPGKTVWVKLPYGDFVIDASEPVFLIAGGTGISAFSAFLASLSARQQHKVTLVYGARTSDLLLDRPFLNAQTETCPNFRIVYFSEGPFDQETPESMRPMAPIWHRGGKIDIGAILALFPDAMPACFYLSGPPTMLNHLTERLKSLGVPDERIRRDAWD